ncbi:VOC family protein [Streptomyces abyssomicinicus]|uniref:VOC family protein n=1 Tax=Streptomyces abyssomicinicus TaxID=574929 RepID=UPI0012503A31|nr:VOC family protein [Streptomyces abyssomicinicus]
MTMSLRLELFVEDLDAFVGFYTTVLGFSLTEDRRSRPEPYAAVARDGVRIGAAPQWADVDRAARRVPTGLEIVLEVDDVRAEYERVVATGHPVAEHLEGRPWGLTDFRLHDADGHYLRVTERGQDPSSGAS